MRKENIMFAYCLVSFRELKQKKNQHSNKISSGKRENLRLKCTNLMILFM